MAKKFRDLIKDIGKEAKSNDDAVDSNIETESGAAMDSLPDGSKEFLKLHSIETDTYPTDKDVPDAFNYSKIKKALSYDINKRMNPSNVKSPILDKNPTLAPVKESTEKHKKHKKHECKTCGGTGVYQSVTCSDCDGDGVNDEQLDINPSFGSIGITMGNV